MARVFSIPLFLALFLLGLKVLALPLPAHAALPDVEANIPLWKSIRDFEDKHAFENYGPPMPQDAQRFQAETRLYQDMVEYFDEAAEDEPDFTFVVEAYSVPVENFRPDVIRPGRATRIVDDPFGEDDPLPEAVQSTSTYVDEIRPTFLPGGPLKQRDPKEVKLGSEKMGSLFAESERLKAETQAAENKAAEGKTAEDKAAAAKKADTESILAGKINAPKKPTPGSNEETLLALRKAVRELGLEKELNFDNKNVQRATPEPEQESAAAKTPPAAAVPAPQAPAPVIKAEPPKAEATPAKPKKKIRKKKRVKPASAITARPLQPPSQPILSPAEEPAQNPAPEEAPEAPQETN